MRRPTRKKRCGISRVAGKTSARICCGRDIASQIPAAAWPSLHRDEKHVVGAVDEAVARLRAVDAQLQELVTLEPLHTRVQRLIASGAWTTSPR